MAKRRTKRSTKRTVRRKKAKRVNSDEKVLANIIGVILVLLGVLGVFVVEGAINYFFMAMGIILAVAGGALVIASFALRKKKAATPAFGVGILYLVVGFALIGLNNALYYYLSLIVGVYFLIAGVAKIAGWYEEAETRIKMVLFGLIDFAFAVIVLLKCPIYSEALLGALISWEILFMGVGLLSVKH